ncbi:TorD/DmsD family molecular chaperone [Halorussus aquaticus]|uniref:Molecular chaperone n=1 Tax=Halorussus aquaticus TaxID=2953748 RepID=A0ABD5Q652_9EURY|nr:molecular chaperone TorD family protein [Halorussus aquaticus]
MDETPQRDPATRSDDETVSTDDETTPRDDGTTATDELPPAERHSARAALYSAAAGAFCYPDEETVAQLTHEATAEGLREAGRKLGFETETEALVEALDATDRESLESAYNDLFGLPVDDGTYPVVPYEAEYTVGDEVGRQQRRIATVVGLLEAFGVEPSDDFDERQDHVVVELELLQVLAARRAVARDEGDDDTADNLERAEAMVLDEHVEGFVPAFAHDVRETTPDPSDDAEGDRTAASSVYRAAANLAEAVVTRDLADHPEPEVDFEASTEVRSRA